MKAVWLALLQGITEFLPVSSSGHLALASRFLKPTPGDFGLSILLHGGTLLATLLFFRKEIAWLVTGMAPKRPGEAPQKKYLLCLAVGTLPLLFFGLILRNQAEAAFNSIPRLRIAFLITALFLAAASLPRRRTVSLGPRTALIIGLFQLAAVIPGVSRSGSTIAAALILGLNGEEAFRFSFLLSLPAVAGAFLLELKHLAGATSGAYSAGLLAAAVLVSLITGLTALWLLRRAVVNPGRLFWYSLYLLILALLLFFLF